MGYRRELVPTAYDRADPRGGFFGDVFHAVTGVVGGAIKGFIGGGPIGGIAGAIGGAAGVISSQTSDAANTPVAGSSAGIPVTPSVVPPSAGIAGTGVPVVMQGGKNVTSADALVRAHQLNIHRAHAQGKISAPQANAMLAKTRKHRRMNWANSRALGRAERRIHSAVKHMTRYIRWVHPHKGGHAAPKFGRKRK